jgi:hypothetical protein
LILGFIFDVEVRKLVVALEADPDRNAVNAPDAFERD